MKRIIIPSLFCVAALQANAALISYYTFDEAPGSTTAADYVRGTAGAATLGTGSAAPTFVASGKIGGALQFNGSTNYAWALNPVANGAQTLTIGAWVWANSAATWGSIVKDWGSGYHFGLDGTSGQLSDYTGGSSLKAPAALTLNTWHYVTFTYDGIAHVENLYIDGTLAQTTSTSVPASLTSGQNVGIGVKLASTTATTPAGSGASPGYWNGMIDDLAFFDTALTQSDIQTIYGSNLGALALVPEPGSLVSLLGGCGVLLGLRRRRC
jgi:hypothetical protein